MRQHPSSHQSIKTMVLAAMFLCLGLVLPFLTGQIPQIGSMLLPMHIPVFLCGLICGWKYGLTVGLVLPVMRALLFTLPPLYPTAVAMSLEMAAYGFTVGFLYEHARWHCIRSLYRCLVLSMLIGRFVWGTAAWMLFGAQGKAFTLSMFLSGAILEAIPGILVQLTLIPAVMLVLNRTGLVPFHKKQKQCPVSRVS